jgi:hypothetical protein
MSPYEIYTAHAKAQREAAAKTSLPNRKMMHERSAEAWELMAKGVEDTAIRAAINLAAKSAHIR